MSPGLPNHLVERASLLRRARQFFYERGVTEVDVCALVTHAPIDSNIDVIAADVSDTERGFLHTSPEYAMKRLLTQGAGDIFFLGHVFRKNELGRFHNPEFTMAEWYRLNFSLDQMIEETCSFLSLFLGSLPLRILSYRDAFKEYAKINYTQDDLRKAALDHGLSPQTPEWSQAAYLHYLLTHIVEPNLGRGELTVLTDYPPDEAALACTTQKNGEEVAERFEIYYEGVELANGYHELSHSSTLRRRLEQENQLRRSLNKETYLLDEAFLSAMTRGLPPCCGVSVGFDRVLMLCLKTSSIHSIIPFSWNQTQNAF